MRRFFLWVWLLAFTACALHKEHSASALNDLVLRTVTVRAEVPEGTVAPVYLSGNIAALGHWNAAGQLVMRTFVGADHNEASWRARLDQPLRFVLSVR